MKRGCQRCQELETVLDALEAARLQYRASMERYERLGEACEDWIVRRGKGPQDVGLVAAIAEWRAGEPKESKEAT